MMYSEAVKVRKFTVQNTPVRHKARNICKRVLCKIWVEAYEAGTLDYSKPPFRGDIGVDFELDAECESEIRRAYDIAVEYQRSEAGAKLREKKNRRRSRQGLSLIRQ